MARSSRFNLLRFFSISSLLLIFVIGAVIIFICRQMLVTQLIESGESANVALANSIANAMWEDHSGYVMNVEETDGDVLRGRPETGLIHRQVEDLVRNIQVLKVKIYNKDAVTIYSSEMSQIGESKAGNEGFLISLHRHRPASKLSRRGSFSAFSGQVSDVALVETYVPILNSRTGQLESVFELYSDVSSLTERIDDTILRLSYLLAALLLILYAALFVVIGRANRTITFQQGELERHQHLVEAANDAMQKEIDVRVKAEKELAHSREKTENGRVLPLVLQLCQDIARVYLKVGGNERRDEVKLAYNDWRKNKILGPSSLNIFISLLSKNLEGQQRAHFETEAQRCVGL